MGMIAGAIFGGEFTTQMVRFIGTNNLLFASVPLVLLAYGCYLIAVTGRPGGGGPRGYQRHKRLWVS